MAYTIRVCVTSYAADFEDAERRAALGQRQRRHKKCGRWHWKNEKCEHPKI